MKFLTILTIFILFHYTAISQINNGLLDNSEMDESSIVFADTCFSFVTDSLIHDIGFMPQVTTSLYKYFKYIGDDDVTIIKSWTGDPHFIDEYSREKLKKNEIYRFKVFFTFIKRPGKFKKKMGFQLSNGERITFTFAGTVIPDVASEFQQIGEFIEGYAPAYYQNNWFFVSNTFTKIIDIPNNCVIRTNELSKETHIFGFSEGMAPVQNNAGYYSFINLKGETIIGFIFSDFGVFKSGIAPVRIYRDCEKSCWGYINSRGKWILQPQFWSAKSVSEGLAEVQINGMYGFINPSGKIAIPLKFTSVGNFRNGLCFVSESESFDNYYVINIYGETVISGPFQDFYDFNNGTAIVLQNKRCLSIDTKGNVLEVLNDSFFGSD